MKKYVVSITEISSGSVIIEAESKEDAENKVIDVFHDGDIHWTDSEISKIEAVECEAD